MRQYRKKNSQKGFTLVELSIVLVIIGLIISSVLVGQDLIRSAELRATVTQYEGYNSALATFKGKYGGLPGDVLGLADFGAGFIADGDNNGVLDQSGTSGHGAGDNVYFWAHLGAGAAGFISGAYDGTAVTTVSGDIALALPKAKAGGYWGVFNEPSALGSGNYFVIGADTPGTNNYQKTTAVLTPLDARGIDEKIDDARPGRGIVQARGTHASNANSGTLTTCASSVSGTDADLDNPILPVVTSTYVTTTATATCTLRLRMQI